MTIKWKFKKNVEIYTDEFWYDVTDGGYLKPEELLSDEKQIKRLQKAIDLVYSFEQAIQDKMEEGDESDD